MYIHLLLLSSHKISASLFTLKITRKLLINSPSLLNFHKCSTENTVNYYFYKFRSAAHDFYLFYLETNKLKHLNFFYGFFQYLFFPFFWFWRGF